jgi:hypothetical protein
MDYYCVNHTQEKAVGLCATCQRPACYRCSLNVNQDIYCSLECFNKLSPPSAADVPAVRSEAAVPAAVAREAAKLDEYSDMIATLNDQSEVVMPAAAADEPSVILKSSEAVDPTTMLGMTPVQAPPRDGSTLILIPGTRRAVMSSSCYFHPDTSAIVLCSKCRSPICSLCAKESAEGLCCTPDCGPADPVGDRERSNAVLFNIGLGVAVLLVLAGAVFIFGSALQREPVLAVKPAAAEEPVPAPEAPKVETPVPAPEPPPAEPPKPAVSPVERPEPVKIEPPPAKVEPLQAKVALPLPVKVEVPKPEPPPPPVAEPPQPEPLVKIVPVAAVLPPPPPPPPPPPLKEPTQLEHDLRCAAALLRESTPLLAEVAQAMHPEWKADADLAALSSKLTTVDMKLKQAREIYALRRKDAPDPALLGRRIDAITQVLEALQLGFDQIRERHKAVGKWPKRS